LLGGRLTLHGYTGFDLLSYYQEGRAQDQNYTLDLGPEYQFTPWLVGAGGYVLSYRASGLGAIASYTRHEGYVRLTLQY
ncbi:MAG: hypothetical protein IRZ16_21310, partial [Myxococcaceae bacterium]|nr:hypothetical protein [Myxococcaceae bacterium]